MLQDTTWPEQLKVKLDQRNVHIDNFAVASNDIFNIKKQIQSLCRLRRFYDVIVIQYTIRPFMIDNFNYYIQWFPRTEVKFQSIQKIKEWIRRMKIYPFSNLFPNYPLHLLSLHNFSGALEDFFRCNT